MNLATTRILQLVSTSGYSLWKTLVVVNAFHEQTQCNVHFFVCVSVSSFIILSFLLQLLYKCMLKFNFSKCITLYVSNNYADRCRLCLFCSSQPSPSCTTPAPHDHNFTTSNTLANCTELHLQQTMPIEGLFY